MRLATATRKRRIRRKHQAFEYQRFVLSCWESLREDIRLPEGAIWFDEVSEDEVDASAFAMYDFSHRSYLIRPEGSVAGKTT